MARGFHSTSFFVADSVHSVRKVPLASRTSLFSNLSIAFPYARRSYYRQAPAASSAELSELLSGFVSVPSRQLNLSTLLSFGRPLTPQSVLASVEYALAEIPRRLAIRVRSLEALPFIVGTNPYVAKTLNTYKESFRWFATHPPVKTIAENSSFVEQLEQMLQKHGNDIPTMAKGFQECSRYMSPTQISNFLDNAIRNRISVRLIAEQHIAISHALVNPDVGTSYVGVVNPKCSPKAMIHICSSFVSELCEATLGVTPSIIIDGHTDATFPYVPVHLEYILTEMLKNAFRATVEYSQRHPSMSPKKRLPPVVITLSPPSTFQEPVKQNQYFSFRIRDQGGGVSPAHMARIFSYAFTTAGRSAAQSNNKEVSQLHACTPAIGNEISGESVSFGEMTGRGVQTGLGTIAGLGYGLPMSQLYAKYFGGSLELMTLEGWGTDIFLRLRSLDEAGDSTI